MVDVETFRQLAMSLHGTTEEPHFEKTSFRVNKRIFATLDVGKELACIMLTEFEQSDFCAFGSGAIYPVPNKWGQKGATYVELKTVRKTLLKDMLKLSYNRIASKK